MKKINGERGQTLIFVALGMTMLLGFVGFATDVGVLLHVKREAQTAADAAALAAATEVLAEGNPTTLSTSEYNAAKNDAVLNGFTPGSSSGTLNSSTGTALTINLPPHITVPAFNIPGYVQASISQTAPTIFIKAFMGLFGNSSYSGMTVGATAIASDTINSNGCVYVTDNGGANPAVNLGGSSDLRTPGCNVTVNGNLDLAGASSMQAKSVAVTGSITGNTPTTTVATGVPPQQIPTFLTNLSLTAEQPTAGTTPGGACGSNPGSSSGLACIYDYQNGNLSGTLPSNTIYYFDEPGGPSITGSVSGTGVMFYLAGNSMPFDFANNGSVSLTAPTSGIYKGVLIDAPNIGGTTTCSSGKGNNVGNPGEIYFDFGNSNTSLNGIIYAPNAQLYGQDQGGSTSINLDLVIGNICMQSSTFTIGGINQNNPLAKIGLVY